MEARPEPQRPGEASPSRTPTGHAPGGRARSRDCDLARRRTPPLPPNLATWPPTRTRDFPARTRPIPNRDDHLIQTRGTERFPEPPARTTPKSKQGVRSRLLAARIIARCIAAGRARADGAGRGHRPSFSERRRDGDRAAVDQSCSAADVALVDRWKLRRRPGAFSSTQVIRRCAKRMKLNPCHQLRRLPLRRGPGLVRCLATPRCLDTVSARRGGPDRAHC